MNRVIGAILLVIVIIFSLPISADNDAIETSRENCNHVESPLDVAFGCEVHINCMFNSAIVNCTEYTLIRLITTCTNFDAHTCVDVALLTTIAIDDAILDYQMMDSTTQLNNSLNAYLNQEYQTAIDLYENVTLSLDYFPHHMLELGLGVLYLRFNNSDVARIQFDKSLNLEFYNPVAFYYRGNTYLQLNNSVRALRDHYMYDLLADPQLKTRLPLRAFTIQIPNSQRWNYYPVYTLEHDNMTFRLQDDTLDLVRSIVVSFVDDGKTLVIADWLDIVAGSETEILFLERDPENPLRYILTIDQQDAPNSILSSATEISVVVTPTHLDLYLYSIQGDSTLRIASIASETNEPDIRTDRTSQLCDNALLSFVTPGAEIEILTDYQQVYLWEFPDPESDFEELIQDETGKPFSVVDGFVCDDEVIWWEISNGTQSGWVTEHDMVLVGSYQLFPSVLNELWTETPPTPLQFLSESR